MSAISPRVIIPMAGESKRFTASGATFPKWLLTVRNKPMIQWVLESLDLPEDTEYVFVCQAKHTEKYAVTQMLQRLVKSGVVLELPGVTKGAAITVQTALEHMDRTRPGYAGPILVANCDQWIRWDPQAFLANMDGVDAGVLTFPAVHPKWSFARVEEDWVTEVAEKQPISPWATVGIYYYRNSQTYLTACKSMVAQNIHTNGEYYVAPTMNEIIKAGGTVKAYPITPDQMWGLGTPEDLEEFKLAACLGRLPC